MTRDDGYTRYTVRIPTPLYERVKAAAGEKSVNAQIVEDLAEKYPAPPPPVSDLMIGIVQRAAQIMALADPAAQQQEIDRLNRDLANDPEWAARGLVPVFSPTEPKEPGVIITLRIPGKDGQQSESFVLLPMGRP